LFYPKRKNLSGSVPPFFDCTPFSPEEHLQAFKRAIRGRRGPNPPPLTDDEYWALGQHHGLKTPLLDWTRSPFVALFFAFEEERFSLSCATPVEPEYRGVYSVSTSVIEAPAKENDGCARFLSPEADANYRLISQGALFVRLPRQTGLEDYVRNHFPDDTHRAILTKIKIPNDDRDKCLVTLDRMNVNHMTLFPDIDGAARYVNSRWRPGHESSIAYV